MSNRSSWVLLAFFALFWNGIVGVFDGVLLHQATTERDARARFVPVEATVTRSSVDASRGSDSTTYSPDIRYDYVFDGERYSSDRYSFTVWASSDRTFSEVTCAKFPVGSTATAYVDPDDPATAALDVSGDSFPYGVLLFLLPFQSIGLLMIALTVSAFRRRHGDEDDLRSRYVHVDNEQHLVIQRPRMRPLTVFATAFLASSFLAMFPTIIFTGFQSSPGIVLAVVGVCTATSVGFMLWRRSVSKRPSNFIHVDRRVGTFAYPADTPGEPLESIQSIVVEPKKTGTVINGVPMLDHTFMAETEKGPLSLFEVRTGQEEADRVMDLLRNELM